MKLYVYKVIRERLDGSRGKRAKSYTCFKPKLKVGGLYVHLKSRVPGISEGLKHVNRRVSGLKGR